MGVRREIRAVFTAVWRVTALITVWHSYKGSFSMEPLLKSPWKRSSRVSTFNHSLSSLCAQEPLGAALRRPPLPLKHMLFGLSVVYLMVFTIQNLGNDCHISHLVRKAGGGQDLPLDLG